MEIVVISLLTAHKFLEPPRYTVSRNQVLGEMASSSSNETGAALLYVAIAKGKTILASHSNGAQNASSIATLILDRIDLQIDSKQTFVHQKYQIHYIHTAPSHGVNGGLTFLAIGTEALGRRIPFACLFDIKHKFMETYSSNEIAAAGQSEFSSFETVMKERMTVLTESGVEGSDKAREVQREIESVKDIMSQNIERVLERGERIDLLVDKSSHLNSSSLAFRKRSQAVKRQMWWQKQRTTALIGLTIFFLIYLMVGIGCGLPAWGRCF